MSIFVPKKCGSQEEWIENYAQEIKSLTENFMMNITAENLVNYLPFFLILPEVPYKPLIVYLAEKKELFIKAVEKCVEQLPSDEKKLEYMESVLHEGSMLKAVLSYQRRFFSRYTIGFFSNTTTVSTLVHKVQELKAICDKTKSEKETLAEQSFALITINK